MSDASRAAAPHLAALRAAAVNLRGSSPVAHELGRARFSLFAALEADDLDGARDWLRAVEVAVRTLDDAAVRVLLLEAVEALRAVIADAAETAA